MKRYFKLLKTIARERRGKLDFPSYVTYQVTLKCNARCIMCDSWKTKSEATLDLQEVEHIFSQLKDLLAIRISGGEPFILPDLAERIQIIHRHTKPYYVHVTSNGFLTDRIVPFVENYATPGNLDMKISIDGYGDTQDQIRGPNAWERSIATVRELAKLRKTKKNFYLGVNQVLTDANPKEQYLELRNELEKIQVPLHTILAVKEAPIYAQGGPKNIAPKYPGEMELFGHYSKSTLEELLTLFEQHAKKIRNRLERWVLQNYLLGLRNRLINKSAQPNPSCIALHRHLRILPNGDVPICYFNTNRVANLREISFQKLWFSDYLKDSRAWVKNCPGCWAGCEVTPSAILTGDLFTQKLKGMFLGKPTKGKSIEPQPFQKEATLPKTD